MHFFIITWCILVIWGWKFHNQSDIFDRITRFAYLKIHNFAHFFDFVLLLPNISYTCSRSVVSNVNMEIFKWLYLSNSALYDMIGSNSCISSLYIVHTSTRCLLFSHDWHKQHISFGGFLHSSRNSPYGMSFGESWC